MPIDLNHDFHLETWWSIDTFRKILKKLEDYSLERYWLEKYCLVLELRKETRQLAVKKRYY